MFSSVYSAVKQGEHMENIGNAVKDHPKNPLADLFIHSFIQLYIYLIYQLTGLHQKAKPVQPDLVSKILIHVYQQSFFLFVYCLNFDSQYHFMYRCKPSCLICVQLLYRCNHGFFLLSAFFQTCFSVNTFEQAVEPDVLITD